MNLRGSRSSVAITGIGIISPIGCNWGCFKNNLFSGVSGISSVTRFDPSAYKCRVAAEVDFESLSFPDCNKRIELRRMDKFVQYAYCAAHEALQMASAAGKMDQEEGALSIGVGLGGLPNIEAGVERQRKVGTRSISPYLIPSLIPNMAASFVGAALNWTGRQSTVAAACASGTIAIGEAAEAIVAGKVRWALAGGTEGVITPITWSGFEAMRVLTRGNVSRPFDKDRDGMVAGEGAAMLVLESGDQAKARGASILGWVDGYGMTTNAEAFVSPVAGSLNDVIKQALEGLERKIPFAVLAQASGLPKGDKEEMEALINVHGGEQALISCIKGQVGHTFAASGPINAAAAIASFAAGRLPSIAGMKNPDYSSGPLNYCKGIEDWMPGPIVITSYGFGGAHAALVISPDDSN